MRTVYWGVILIIALPLLTRGGILPGDSAARIRIVFYNTENLFDIEDDPLTRDAEFTPEGTKGWNNYRLYRKLNGIARVITGAGGWTLPALVGLCEVENRRVLDWLVFKTPLSSFDYSFIHYDSPDARGVDVALLYRRSVFTALSSRSIRICFPFDTAASTRDILYIKGTVFGGDTLHLLVNHWPSRAGGTGESRKKRTHVAAVVRSLLDTLVASNPAARIILMGDFNEEPFGDILTCVLKAKTDTLGLRYNDLYNTMARLKKGGRLGTCKYRGKWSVFDQFIVSASLLNSREGWHVVQAEGFVFAPDYLLEEDSKNFGKKPFRTYQGPLYLGGFSDHLPVFLDLIH
jgi:hypothetical protein